MAGFFDALLGLENNPEDRDYKTAKEITSPEEMEAYRAGASATGLGIPGLDYARSMMRGVGKEITDPSMGALGERYNEEMDRYRRRQEEFKRLQELYPAAVRGGRLRGSESIPGAEVGLMAQPAVAGAARLFGGIGRGGAGRTAGFGGGPSGFGGGPSILEGEFTEVPNYPQLNYSPGRKTFFQEPQLNARRSMVEEMHAAEPTPDAPLPIPKDIRKPYSPVVPEAPAPREWSDFERQMVRPDTPSRFDQNALNLMRRGKIPPTRGMYYDEYGNVAPPSVRDTTAPISKFEQNWRAAQKRSLDQWRAENPRMAGAMPVRPEFQAFSESELPVPYNLYQRYKPDSLRSEPPIRNEWSPVIQEMDRKAIKNEMPSKFDQNTLNLANKGYYFPETRGIHEPMDRGLVNSSIAARKAEEAAKAARISKMPPGMRENMDRATAARLQRGAEEARSLLNRPGGQFRNEAFAESELPVVQQVNRNIVPVETPVPPGLREKALRLARTIAGGAVAGGAGAEAGKILATSLKGEPTNIPLPPRRPEMDIPVPLPPRRPEMDIPKVAADHPAHVAARPARKAVSRPAPSRRMAPGSNQMYWGDWRDVEPYASDPLGNLIDTVTGDVRSSRKRGTLQSPMSGYRGRKSNISLGDLLPFADGGSVRHHFADGGVGEDRIPILSDIGDALGGLFSSGGGGEKRVVAQDAEPEEGFFERWAHNPLSQYLFASGLGMMAASRRGTTPGEAIGEGGLKGLEYMQALRKSEAERRERLQDQRLAQSVLGGSFGEEGQPETRTAENVPAEVPAGGAERAPAVPTAPKTEAAAEPTTKAPVAATPKLATTPSTIDVVSKDPYLEQLYAKNRAISAAMITVKTPATKSSLEDAQRAVQFEITRREAAIEKARAEVLRRQQEERLAKKEALEEYRQTPEGIREKVSTEEAVKAEPKIIQSTSEAAQDSENKLEDLQKVLEGYKTGKIHTSPWIQSASKFIQQNAYDVGLPKWAVDDWLANPQSIANTEALEQLGVVDLMKKIGGSLGPSISEGDRATIEKQALGFGKSPETNIRMLHTLEKMMRRSIEARDFMKAYREKHGYLDANYQQALSDHFANKPLGLEKTTGEGKTSRSENPTREEILEEKRKRRASNG